MNLKLKTEIGILEKNKVVKGVDTGLTTHHGDPYIRLGNDNILYPKCLFDETEEEPEIEDELEIEIIEKVME